MKIYKKKVVLLDSTISKVEWLVSCADVLESVRTSFLKHSSITNFIKFFSYSAALPPVE